MPSKRIVGLTGGIASGKTFISQYLLKEGFPVYFADSSAKDLMEADAQLKQQLITILGHQAYFPDGKLNREWIAQTIFHNTNLLAQVNQIVHQAVWKDFQRWCAEQSHSILLIEAAILLETGWYTRLDGLIYVYAPIRLRYCRFSQKYPNPASFWSRLQHQMNPHLAFSFADFIFFNDEIHSFAEQYQRLIHFLWSVEKRSS